MKSLVFLFLVLFIQICNGRAEAVELSVVANSKHISIVVPMEAVPDSFLPRDINYRSYKYLDLSMGQDPYFYKKDPSITDGLKALVFRSPSVIRLHPFSTDLKTNFPKKNIVTFDISETQLSLLLKYIQNDFSSKEVAIHRNEDAHKYFYKAKSIYSFFNTCVTWIVRGLRTSGLNITEESIPHYSTTDAFNKISQITKIKSIFRYEEE